MLKILSLSTYSFIGHPVEKLHQIIPEILPGIEKIITVYHDEMSGKTAGSLTQKKNHAYTTLVLNVEAILPDLKPYRIEKNPYNWYDPEKLPFDIAFKESNPTIDIFSELKNIVLLLRLPGSDKDLKDLVFLYFNENPSNFGITSSDHPLTTDDKSIIAFVLNNTIRTLVGYQLNDRDILRSHNRRTRQIIDQTESLKYEMQRTRESYGISLVKLCQQIIKERSTRNGMNFKLMPGAIEKIKNYKGDIKDLETIMQDTLDYAESLYTDHKESIEILEWHIIFETPTRKEEEITMERGMQEDKFSKTIMLLDKLEQAALVAKSRQLKLTGTAVGNLFPQRVSAPAISDALYNHKSKINNLVKMFPDKWETIRNEFKPLRNILIEE